MAQLKSNVKDIYSWTKSNHIPGLFYINLGYVTYEILLTEWESDKNIFYGKQYGLLFCYEKTPQAYGYETHRRFFKNEVLELNKLLELAYNDVINHYP